jgi:hypothetical protein
MMCTVIAVNRRGWESAKLNVQTSVHVGTPAKQLLLNDSEWPVVDGRKKILAAMILLTRLPMESLAKAKLTWQRETDGKWETLRTSDELLLTCNDIGHRIRAVAANGLTSTPAGPVECAEVVWSCARAQIKAKSYAFPARARMGAIVWNVTVAEKGALLSSSKGVKKIGKWRDVHAEAIEATESEMVLWIDPATKFVVEPGIHDKRLEERVKKENVRDFTVLIISGMKQWATQSSS